MAGPFCVLEKCWNDRIQRVICISTTRTNLSKDTNGYELLFVNLS